MQAQPAELLTTALQALKQRAHQLLESQRSLQQQNQALAADCLGFQSERDSIQQQWETLQTTVKDLQRQLSAQGAQTAEQSQQREVLQARVEDLQGQYTALGVERDQLLQTRDALQNQVHTQQDRLDRINIELDEILALIEHDRSNVQQDLAGCPPG